MAKTGIKTLLNEILSHVIELMYVHITKWAIEWMADCQEVGKGQQ